MPAIALTDHGVMYGVMEFYHKAKARGVKPIIGCEVYIVTKGSRFDKGKDIQGLDSGFTNIKLEKSAALQGKPGKQLNRKSNYDHLVLLAKNEQGYKNLVKLVSLAQIEGFYYKPRLDVELLKQYSGDLVALSACAGGVVSTHLVKGNLEEAKEAAVIYKEIFNNDFYLEIQNHGIGIEQPILENMPRIAKDVGLKLIASNDIHYIKHEHAIPHNLFLYINTDLSREKEGLDLEKDLRYGTDQVYFKSAEQMCELFKKFPEAIDSTFEVTEKCNLELPVGVYHMPNFPVPSNSGVNSLDEYLEKLAHEGLNRKIKNVTSEERDRLNQELEIIKQMNFSGYFLIVSDFINHAKLNNVLVGPGRGSAAGSLVCYALGITNVNPLEYNLLFERFLNPERVSMPDIDIDFQDDKRDDVINYSKNKYGENSVSQIITFNKLKTKAVLKDVGRVLNYPFDAMNEITKHVPSIFGKVKSLEDCYNEIPEFKQYFDEVPDRKKLLNYSIVLENLNKNVSMHASGVVIAPSDITDYVPVSKTPQMENQYMTQFDMKMLEKAGLIKMDFLGLKELKIIQHTIELIEKFKGIKIDIDSLDMNDTKTYELFSAGNTIGVFQFSRPKMREYLTKLKPQNINDLAAMNALYRPGPMDLIPDFIDRKYGKKEVTYPHPKIESILKETYGVIVYQEQVMQIVREVAGYSLAKADVVRRAMGKKDEKLMKEQEKEFITGAVSNGFDRKTAKEIFRLILKFADYGFNKSHSVAYSILAYYTAYFKTHYPLEFMTAQLNCRKDDMDEMVLLINDARRMGINICRPDINKCFADYTIDETEDNKILYGLSSIKNIGEAAVRNFVKEREENGKFEHFVDFCTRVDTRLVNKKTIEALIYAGAFDSIEPNRRKLFDNYDMVVQRFSYKSSSPSQSSLFSGIKQQGAANLLDTPEYNSIRDWSEKEKLSHEKSVLGLYLSSHPLKEYEEEINSLATLRFGDIGDVEEEKIDFSKLTRVKMCGIISKYQVKQSKKGNKFATFILEDFTGHGECIVFGKNFDNLKDKLHNDNIMCVVGKAEENGNAIKLIVEDASLITKRKNGIAIKPEKITIKINARAFRTEKIYELKKLLNSQNGGCEVIIEITNENGNHKTFVLEGYNIEYNQSAKEVLENLFGRENVLLTYP